MPGRGRRARSGRGGRRAAPGPAVGYYVRRAALLETEDTQAVVFDEILEILQVQRRERQVGDQAAGELKVRGQVVTLADPSGGTFNAAGDFDRLLPVAEADFPVLPRIDSYGDGAIPNAELAALASEVTQLLERANGARQRGPRAGSFFRP